MTGLQGNVVCVGPGRMGRGIAHVFAYAGRPVTLVDIKPRDAADAQRAESEALAEVRQTLTFLASLGVLDAAQVSTALTLIDFVHDTEADAALAHADIVFEAVPEIVEVKQAALERMARAVQPDAVIASTTSTMLHDSA